MKRKVYKKCFKAVFFVNNTHTIYIYISAPFDNKHNINHTFQFITILEGNSNKNTTVTMQENVSIVITC